MPDTNPSYNSQPWGTARRKPRRHLEEPVSAAELLRQLFAGMQATPEFLQLQNLWQHWNDIVGPGIRELAQPLGQNRDILLLACPDSMAMQEVQMLSADILECVNAYLGRQAFSSIRLSLGNPSSAT